MAYWNGTSWVPDTVATSPRRQTRVPRLLGAATEASLIVLLAFGLVAGTTFAAKGGNGGNPNRQAASCQVDGDVVSATGLPTDEVINFMVTDEDGTWGWVLGFTWEGTWSVTVPERSGPTTYEFVSRTWGPDGSKYTVFSSCSTAS